MELENKYNHAVKLLADAYRYRLNGENFEFKSSLNDAGENFSQVIELAVKQHLASKDNKIWEYYKRTPFPKTIFDNYVSEDGDKGDFYYDTIAEVDSDVDFEFLASNKNKLTNRSKHGGIDVDESVVERYRLEIKKFLHDYIDENACLKNIDDFLKPENDDISNFYNACDMFHYEDRTFVLITDEKKCPYYSNFGKIKWDLIIDFYNESEKDGYCFCNYGLDTSVIKKFKVDDIVSGDDYSPYSDYPIVVFANGFRNLSKRFTNSREWNRNNSSKLENMLRILMERNHSQKTIVVSTIRNEEFTAKLIDLCDRCFVNMQMVIVNQDDNETQYPDYVVQIPISMSDVSQCIDSYVYSGEAQTVENSFRLPALGSELGVFSKAEMSNLEETFEVLYAGIEKTLVDDVEDFLMGKHSLSWYGAKNEFPAYRDKFTKMYVKPLESVIKNGHAIIYIEHQPGFGGSTLARQLAWYFHGDYPVLFLKKNRENHIVEQLELIHNKTKKRLSCLLKYLKL